MPRGVPKSGFRKTKNYKVKNGLVPSTEFLKRGRGRPSKKAVPEFVVTHVETDAQIAQRLSTRFSAMDQMTEATILGVNRAVIVSGPPGLGKSFGVEKLAEKHANKVMAVIVRGYARATGIYKVLYEHREAGNVVIFDDADAIFEDMTALNILKAATDSNDKRTISWLSEAKLEDEDGERLPRSFEFQGSVVFLTNVDFDGAIARGSKLSPHFQALISRSHYLDLTLRTARDYLTRIKQVVFELGMLDGEASFQEKKEIVDFIEQNQDSMRELSLRMVRKLATLKKMDGVKWQELARVTCCR
jgi:hypothetical protein